MFLDDYVVHIEYLYTKTAFIPSYKKGETTICVKAETESGAKDRARRQLETDLKQKGYRLGNYSIKGKKM